MKIKAPKDGSIAKEGAIVQVLLDADYQLLDSRDLAKLMLRTWDVRWKAPIKKVKT